MEEQIGKKAEQANTTAQPSITGIKCHNVIHSHLSIFLLF